MTTLALPLLWTSLTVVALNTSSPWNTLEKDLDAWMQEDAWVESAEEAEALEERFHADPVLFPAWLSEVPPTDSAPPSGPITGATPIAIQVEGRSVVLRDVPSDAWFAPFIATIAARSLVSGYRDEDGRPTGYFGPQDSVTIGQVLKVLVQAVDIDPEECPAEPANVTARGHWSAPFVACAEAARWSLLAEERMDVDRPATRSEVVGALLEAFSVEPSAPVGPLPFTDVRLTLPYASAVFQAQRDGIVSGYADPQGNLTGRFGPGDPVTRAEFAKIVIGGLQAYER